MCRQQPVTVKLLLRGRQWYVVTAVRLHASSVVTDLTGQPRAHSRVTMTRCASREVRVVFLLFFCQW